MTKGKLVVLEGIYGTGKLLVQLAERLREGLGGPGKVYEIDSPDSGRAQLMGASELECGWRYGLFLPDLFFELASRARACAVIRDELREGKLVLCKSFTLSSIVYAKLKGHDWFREDLNCLEARARGLNFGGEVSPDLTIYVDMDPEAAAEQLGPRLESYFPPNDLALQAKYYREELAALPSEKVAIINAAKGEGEIAAEALSLIRKIL